MADRLAEDDDSFVRVTCEECGETSDFPASQRGSVQECLHCASYVDVEEGGEPEELDAPGPDEDDEDEVG
jgi:hypothetical protein